MEKILEFLGIPSPAVALGLVLGLVALCGAVSGWSYHAGHVNGFDAAESARATSQDKAIAALGTELAAAREQAVAFAAATAAAVAKADEHKRNLDTATRDLRNEKAKPAPTCVADSWRVRVNAAVDAANASVAGEGNPTGLPIAVPTSSTLGGGLKRLGSGIDLGSWGVHPTTRDLSNSAAQGTK